MDDASRQAHWENVYGTKGCCRGMLTCRRNAGRGWSNSMSANFRRSTPEASASEERGEPSSVVGLKVEKRVIAVA
jgi:hypothetical protein